MLFISEISEDDSAKFLKNQVTGRQVVLLNPYCNEILNSDLLDVNCNSPYLTYACGENMEWALINRGLSVGQ